MFPAYADRRALLDKPFGPKNRLPIRRARIALAEPSERKFERGEAPDVPSGELRGRR